MITVTIGGVTRTTLIESISIANTVNSQVDTCDFTIIKAPGDSYTPALNAEVIVSRDSVVIFGGVIATVSDELVGTSTLRFKVSCIDYSFFLNRKLATERYTDQTINYIINNLVTKYASDFTVANVFANINVKSIAFNRITIGECLRELADLVNYNWYVDYNKDIHFFASNGEVAPFNAIDGNYIRETLSIQKDITQLRNRVIVQGGEVKDSTTSTVTLAGNGVTTQFPTQYKFATLPTVSIAGVGKTVGVDFLDDDTLFQCMWNFNQKYIRFTAGNVPPVPIGPATTNITITGTPLLPIAVNIPDAASIAIYGEKEFAITDKNIASQDQAIDRALAELSAYANSISEGGFDTYRAGLRSGQVIRITDSLRGLDENFVIQKVQFRYLSTDATYDAVWGVTVATLKTVGIISVLQKLLLNEDLTVDEQETLLTLLSFSDAFSASDTMGTVTTTSRPYYIGTTAVCGFSTIG